MLCSPKKPMKMNLWKICTIALAGLLCSSSALRAQRNAAPVEAQIHTRSLLEKVEVEAVCKNNSNTDRPLYYRLRVYRTDQQGNTASTFQGGSFEVKARRSATLSSTTINTQAESQVRISLMIYEMGVLIASDSLVLGQAEEQQGYQQPTLREATAQRGAGDQSLELGGLILNGTRTRAGKEFYDNFYSIWQMQTVNSDGDFLIRIDETPIQTRTTQVKIKLNDTEIFQRPLMPNSSQLKQLATYAVKVTQYHLQNLEQVKKDLESGDVLGNGIF